MAAVHCSYCTFCCLTRFDLIKHTFASHSVELNFKFVCGIKGCLHSFRPGATFSSFKTHCSRKHPNWQDCLKERVSSPPALPHVGSLDLTSPEMSPDPGLDPDHDPDPSTQDSDSIHEPTEAASFLSIQRTSAMFLLSCQERFKLPQTAINFAIVILTLDYNTMDINTLKSNNLIISIVQIHTSSSQKIYSLKWTQKD